MEPICFLTMLVERAAISTAEAVATEKNSLSALRAKRGPWELVYARVGLALTRGSDVGKGCVYGTN